MWLLLLQDARSLLRRVNDDGDEREDGEQRDAADGDDALERPAHECDA